MSEECVGMNQRESKSIFQENLLALAGISTYFSNDF